MNKIIEYIKSKKITILIIMVLIIFSIFILINKVFSADANQDEIDSSVVSVMAVGDIIAHDSINKEALNGESGVYEYQKIFEYYLPMFEQADILYANLETTINNELPVAGYPTFNAHTDLVDSLVNSGFNLLSIANNHILDTGEESLVKTNDYIKETYPEVAVSGYNDSCDNFEYESFTINGIDFTYSAFTQFVNKPEQLYNCNVNMIDSDNYDDNIDALTSTGDVNIVSIHYGEENNSQISSSDQEIVDYLLGSGVEVILGTHPHVLKPIEKTVNSEGNEALVAYSLGNFLHSQIDEEQKVGGILQFDIIKTGQKIEIDNIIFHPTYMYYEWGDQSEQDLNSRTNFHVMPLSSLSTFTSQEVADNAKEIYTSVIEEQYRAYFPPTAYSSTKQVVDPSDFLMLVNKNNYLPENYEPESLVIPDVLESTRTSSDVHYIDQRIADDVEALFKGAKQAGYDLVFVSGFRPYETQVSLYNSYVSAESVQEADRYSARPGFSEHQTGLSFDISEQSIGSEGVEAFNDTEASIWIEDNAHKYGFIVRYPQGKEDVTQYMHESWHLRYVGVEVATEIYEENLTLEEYLFYEAQTDEEN